MSSKSFPVLLLLLLLCSTSTAQKREVYEFERNLPIYADSLIADLNFPLA